MFCYAAMKRDLKSLREIIAIDDFLDRVLGDGILVIDIIKNVKIPKCKKDLQASFWLFASKSRFGELLF